MWIVGRIKWQGVVCLSRGNRQEGEGEESDSKERARHGSSGLPSNINQPSSGPGRADFLISSELRAARASTDLWQRIVDPCVIHSRFYYSQYYSSSCIYVMIGLHSMC